jgi:hypothetical protein
MHRFVLPPSEPPLDRYASLVIAVSGVLDLYLSLRELSPGRHTFATACALTLAGSAIYVEVRWFTHHPSSSATPH